MGYNNFVIHSMSKWILYDYLNTDGYNVIKKWTEDLQKRERIKLNQKLDMLEQYGPELPPQLLAGPIFDHVYKLKVQGNPKLRPLLCKGPIDNSKEYTLLVGAKEIQWELEPVNAEEQAASNRQAIIDNPLRRCKHERVS
jgi:hypothetical protein